MPSCCVVRLSHLCWLLWLDAGSGEEQTSWWVVCLAEPIHRTGQDTQIDQGQQNCLSRGEPASSLDSAHYESMCLWCMWCIWMQRGPGRSFCKCSARRTVINFEQRPFDLMCLSDCICLYLCFSHQASLGTVFGMEITLLMKMRQPLLHTVSLDVPSVKLSFLTKETGTSFWAEGD